MIFIFVSIDKHLESVCVVRSLQDKRVAYNVLRAQRDSLIQSPIHDANFTFTQAVLIESQQLLMAEPGKKY